MKEKSLIDVEESIWQASNSANYYAFRQFDKPKHEYPIHVKNVTKFIKTYKTLKLSSSEKSNLGEFEKVWKTAAAHMDKFLQDIDKLNTAESEFWESVHFIDDIIDFEIQLSLVKRISK